MVKTETGSGGTSARDKMQAAIQNRRSEEAETAKIEQELAKDVRMEHSWKNEEQLAVIRKWKQKTLDYVVKKDFAAEVEQRNVLLQEMRILYGELYMKNEWCSVGRWIIDNVKNKHIPTEFILGLAKLCQLNEMELAMAMAQFAEDYVNDVQDKIERVINNCGNTVSLEQLQQAHNSLKRIRNNPSYAPFFLSHFIQRYHTNLKKLSLS